MNFVIYSITLMVGFGNEELSNWPYVTVGEDKVDPLRDERVAKLLRRQGFEHCCAAMVIRELKHQTFLGRRRRLQTSKPG